MEHIDSRCSPSGVPHDTAHLSSRVSARADVVGPSFQLDLASAGPLTEARRRPCILSSALEHQARVV